jgi:hypothetical protein
LLTSGISCCRISCSPSLLASGSTRACCVASRRSAYMPSGLRTLASGMSHCSASGSHCLLASFPTRACAVFRYCATLRGLLQSLTLGFRFNQRLRGVGHAAESPVVVCLWLQLQLEFAQCHAAVVSRCQASCCSRPLDSGSIRACTVARASQSADSDLCQLLPLEPGDFGPGLLPAFAGVKQLFSLRACRV